MSRRITLLLCAFVLAWLALPARATTIWVGNTSSDTACDADNLAAAMFIAALNGTPSDIIRISNEGGGTSGSYPNTSAVLEGNDLVVEGGYANCSGSAGGAAVLDGTGGSAAPVIQVTCSSTGCNTRRTITLRNLVLKNGEAGGVDVSGNVAVNLDGVTLIQNSNTDGGALHVDASQNATVNMYGLSSLRNSTASGNGGGIYCSGFPAGGSAFQIFMTDALIYQNNAVDGGGVYLTNGCRMRDQATTVYDGLNVNTASGNGGGVAVTGGAHFELTGSGAAPAVILNNQAAQGGGVYVEGSGSVFAAVDSRIDSNTSSGSGGGLYVTDQGLATVLRNAALDTCERAACVSLSNNTAVSGNGGGAGYVRSLGTLTVRGAWVRFNQARYGSAFEVTSYGGAANYGTLNLSSAVVANNFGALAVVQSYQSQTRLDGVTFYGNSGSTSGFWGSLAESGSAYTATPDDGIFVSRSIFDDAGGGWAYGSTSSNIQAQCIVTLNAGTSVTLPGDSLMQDPMLRNPASSDFMPADRSPAIDLCNSNSVLSNTDDINRYPRGNDVLRIGNIAGPYDAGAIESDLIFFGDYED